MIRSLACALFVLAAGSAGAMGMTEDPLEVLTRTWTLETVRSLEIRGEIQFQLAAGPQPRVTVKTSRALFDQLTISNWWGQATVAIESGLRGPRERGTVEVLIELPSLDHLTVLDHSSGQVSWPQGAASVRVGENSSLELTVEGPSLAIEASWLSSVRVRGAVQTLTTSLRHQARLNARDLKAEEARLQLDEKSTVEAGSTVKGSGIARHGSRVTVPVKRGWEEFTLKEDSVLLDRAESP